MFCKVVIFTILFCLFANCQRKQPNHTFSHLVLLPMTPVKNQGESELCWAYAMLATIETEHILRGDSVNLSAVYVGRVLPDYQHSLRQSPSTQRAMGKTLLNVMEKYGVVGYDVLPDDATKELPTPKYVFFLGARYSPREFAHSVCAPEEYLALTCWPDSPYYKNIEVPVPDNWEHNRLLNVPMDTLCRRVNRALRHRHPVCWESRGHAMEVVGMARDENRRPYYVMKNSWGPEGPHDGLVYMPVGKMWRDMIAIYMAQDAWNQH